MTIRAAGILIVDTAGRALFLKRGPGGDMPGLWCFPGGRLEDGEDAIDAAIRETKEEAGYEADRSKLVAWTRRVSAEQTTGAAPTPPAGGAVVGAQNTLATPGTVTETFGGEDVDFTTFLLRGIEEFTPKLGPEGSPEHVAYAWAPLDQPPEPLHPGARIALERAGMDELAVARAIAAGELTSPQRYGKFWLFDIRITGTGASFRPSLSEYVWRDRSLYLTEEFLARCNGLPVIWVHPEKKPQIDGEEFAERAIGTTFIPYFKGEDVWAVVKIYDEEAARQMEREPLSTSPGVVFTQASGNQELKLKDGSTLLIEGKPALLDHIAIVSAGVWDKGGAPSGVSSAEVNMDKEKEVGDKAAEAANNAAVLDAIRGLGTKLDSIHARVDALEKGRVDGEGELERKAKEEREREEREDARRARRDSARKDRFGARKDGESEEDYRKRHDADEMGMMDAMRKDGASEEEAREDARRARHDAEEEERDKKGEFEREDKARKDAEAKEREEREREDAARRDAEEKARQDGDVAAELRASRRRIAALESSLQTLTREQSAEDRDALANAQARADSVAAMFGERASAPMAGESPISYRKRLLAKFLAHSPQFKDVRLDDVQTDGVLGVIERQVYSDAADAARRVDDARPGVLIPVIERDSAGRQITKFNGDNLAWMAPFMTGGQVVRINRNPNGNAA